MARAEKTQAVAELADRFRSANGVVLTDYRGLSVAQLKALRRSLGASAKYTIVKNTLTLRAVQDAGIAGLADMLVGPSAVAFITGDVVEAAKGLKQFGKENPALVVKGGHLDGRALTPEEIGKLADLESREILLAKLAGAMKASTAGAAALFAAPVSKAARTFEALRVRMETEPAESAEPTQETTGATREAPGTQEG